jgi:hypothetical protein
MSYKHISGWVEVTGPEGPIDPGFGRPGGGWSPADPGYGHPGWGPVDPGFGRPGGPVDPGYGHGSGLHPSHGLPISPGHPGNKPPGRPILPPGPDNGLPPMGGAPPHPWIPGHWEILDPGFGKPPLIGFFPIDPGWGIDEGGPPPVVGGGLPTPPGRPPVVGGGLPTPPGRPPVVGGGLPTPPGRPPVVGGGPSTPPVHPWLPGHGGNWVPTDPDWGIPGCPGGKPHPPIWAWIPHPPDFGGGIPQPPAGGTAATTLNPSTVTVLASGGSGSVNVTTDPAGPWSVDPASVPDWVTINPMSSETSDKNVVYSATKNTTGLPKQAFVKVNDAVLTINQGAV